MKKMILRNAKAKVKVANVSIDCYKTFSNLLLHQVNSRLQYLQILSIILI